MAANMTRTNGGDTPADKRSPGRRVTVAVLDRELQITRDELEHVKQAQAGLAAKLERLEDALVRVAIQAPAPPAGTGPLHRFLDLVGKLRQYGTPLATQFCAFWRASKYRVYGALLVADVVAWLLSWDGVFSALFGLIMLVVILESLKFAGAQFVFHYRDAQKRVR